MHFLLMAVLGVLLLIFALKFVSLGKRSLLWKKVEGEILEALIVGESGDSNRRHKMTSLMVRYRYWINGKEYINDKVRFKWTNQNIISESKKYYAGKKLSVYVDPENHVQSVLEPGVDASNYIAIFAAFFFISVGVLLAIYA